MNPKNIMRLKIIYCIVWLAYPFWLFVITQGALWAGAAALGFLAQDGSQVAIAVVSFSFLIFNIILGFMLPAGMIAGNDVFHGGPTWSRLMDALESLHYLKQREAEEAQAKRRAEIEEAVRLAQETRR